MHVRVGTSGYAYKEWKGPFYPDDCKADDMLGFYASRLSTVEINNTFYRMPRENVVLSWADQVPDEFRFVLKASRRITHFGRLNNVEDELRYFLQTSSALGDKRGPSLFQLPPNMKCNLDVLRAFLGLIPRGWHAAFEFRHASWFDEPVYDALREKNAALCMADTDVGDPSIVGTADWGYLRLRGEDYSAADLDRWAAAIAEQDWREAYVFFKHEDAGAGPRLAGELDARMSPGRRAV
ncbi:MAG TPA: DUF72 domain-containing protein [Gemmatimonadales bacterium]